MKAFQKIHSQKGQLAPPIILFLVVFFVLLTFNITHIAPQHFAVVFLAVIVFILAFLKIDFAIGLLIFSMLLSPELKVAQTIGRAVVLRIDDIFLFVILLGWLAKLTVHKELKLLKTTPLDQPIKIYIFVCLIATGIGLISRQQNLARSFFYLLKYIEYFMLYFLVVHNMRDKKLAQVFVLLMILTCFVVSAYASYDHLITGERATAPFEGREGGEPNTLSGYLVLLMAVMMGLFFYLKSFKIRAALLAVLSLAFLALLYTLSRGGWLSFIFMYLAMIVLIPRQKVRAFLILAAALMIVLSSVIFPKEVKERVSYTFTPGRKSYRFQAMGKKVAIDESGSYRIVSLKAGWKQLLQSPLIGHGVPTLSLVDTQFMRTAMETGALGLLAFGFILVRLFGAGRHCLWSSRLADDGFGQGLATGYLAGFVGVLIHSFSAATFIIVRIMEPFWFLTAIVVSLPSLLPTGGADKGTVVADGT